MTVAILNTVDVALDPVGQELGNEPMGGGKVLVVEDEPVIGELIRDILELHHYETQLASTGQEGIFRAEDWQPDVVILDLMLPDVDGFEVCRSVRAAVTKKSPGVLMLTGLLTYEGRLRGFQAGADRFLLKPFQVPDLVRQLESLFTEYREHRHAGLRHQFTLRFQRDSKIGEQIPGLLVELTRSTPLAPADIEAIGAAILDMTRRLMKWSNAHDMISPWQLICRIYRDRLECQLNSLAESGSIDAYHWHEAVRRRFQGNEMTLMIDHAMGDIVFSEQNSSVMTTRPFANLLTQ
jgi:DNA-binding response OmpR family regulator